MDIAITFNTPPSRDTGLSANARQSAVVLQRHGYNAEAVALAHVGHWEDWLAGHHPRVVIISAVTVPLAKFRQLAERYPKIQWVQRIHSNSSFLLQEVCAFGTCLELMHMSLNRPNVHYAVVCPSEAQRWTLAGQPVMALPNVWAGEIPSEGHAPSCPTSPIHLSAFFAIRLLKAAPAHVLAAAVLNKRRPAVLHMQLERTDHQVYGQNLQRMAERLELPLVIEPYRPHDEFTAWLAANIHVGLQLSLTESFNYVAMEHMAQGIPCVCSPAVEFAPFQVNAEDAVSVADAVEVILRDYPAHSALALSAARAVQAKHERIFLDGIESLIGPPRVAQPPPAVVDPVCSSDLSGSASIRRCPDCPLRPNLMPPMNDVAQASSLPHAVEVLSRA